MTKDFIRHPGIVESIEKHKVTVRITQKAACSDCHAKSVCLSSDRKEKLIDVYDSSGKYTLNEEVVVSAQSSIGFFAVILAFVAPLVLVIITLFAGIKISGDEGISGLIGLSILIPYYFILYIFRGNLNKKFVFTLSKMEACIAGESLNTVTN